MKTTTIRGIPDEVYSDVLLMAGEEKTSANKIMLEAIIGAVEVWRKAEKKRLQKRLDDLNQGRLV
jgi:predicted transcriptional regulator